MNYSYRSSRGKYAVSAVVILLILVVVGFAAGYRTSARDVSFEVQGTERIVSSEESYYLVFTSEGPLKNEDSVLFGKFRSSDIQNQMREGVQCDATVAGWRIPLFSTYPNIIEATCQE